MEALGRGGQPGEQLRCDRPEASAALRSFSFTGQSSRLPSKPPVFRRTEGHDSRFPRWCAPFARPRGQPRSARVPDPRREHRVPPPEPHFRHQLLVLRQHHLLHEGIGHLLGAGCSRAPTCWQAPSSRGIARLQEPVNGGTASVAPDLKESVASAPPRLKPEETQTGAIGHSREASGHRGAEGAIGSGLPAESDGPKRNRPAGRHLRPGWLQLPGSHLLHGGATPNDGNEVWE